MSGDPYWASVSALCRFDGVNGSAAAVDSSASPRTLTLSGAASISASRSQFGGSSLGLTGGFAFLDGNAAFAFGTGDFTIEGWLYRTATGQMNITSFNPTSTTGLYPEVYITSDVLAFFVGGVSGTPVITGTTTVAINTWYHFALSRVSGVTRLYLNGTQEGSSYTDANNYVVGASRPTIGAGGYNQTTPVLGNIDDFRITKGVGRYAANFSAPTAAYPIGIGQVSGSITTGTGDANYANVTTLLSGGGTDLSTTFTDSGPSPMTYVAHGGAKISATQSKYHGTSMSFGGSGDYLTTTSGLSGFSVGTGDFTIEFWAYKSAQGASGFDCVCSTYSLSNSSDGYWVELSNSRGFVFASNAAVIAQYNSAVNDSTWHHWVVCRTGTTLRLFKDGVIVATATSSASLGAALLKIGSDFYNEYFNGYIEDFRVTKGFARYTAAFTPPSAALPNVSAGAARMVRAYRRDTGALLQSCYTVAPDANFNYVTAFLRGDAANDASLAARTLTLNGNAKLSSVQTKFGHGVWSFDGTNSYITVGAATADFNLGAHTTYTFEGWFYFNSIANSPYLFHIEASASVRTAINYNSATDKIEIYSNSAGTTLSSSVLGLAALQWYHIAVVLSGGTTRIFVNGALVGTVTQTYANVSSTLILGSAQPTASSNYFNGYMAEVRASMDTARYTAAFTPPTDRFPDASSVGLGSYSFYTPTLDELTVIALDAANAGTYYDDLAIRVIPA